MSGLLKFDPWEAIGKPNPQREAAERRLDAAIDRAERVAIRNEPELPPPGSAARNVIDLAQARVVRGLLAAARVTSPAT